MQIHQMSVTYLPEQDRILLRINTTEGEETRMWLTRRLMVGLWPLLTKLLTDHLLHWYLLTLQAGVALTPVDLVTLPTLSALAQVLLCLLILCVLFAPGTRRRIAALVLIPFVFAWPRERLPAGTIRVAVLDVGQGLAVVVSTRNHNLLYDTGPYFSARFDAGSDVVVPYLRHRNLPAIVLAACFEIDRRG